MPKFKVLKLKQITIRNGRICRSTLTRPRFDDQEPVIIASTRVENVGAPEEPCTSAHPEEQIPEHVKRKNEERDAWEKVKKDLRMAYYESTCPAEGLCIICNLKPNWPVTCRDCSRTGNIFCRGCAVMMHKKHCLLHTVVEWQDEHSVSVAYECTFTRKNHECPTMFTRSVKVFNDRGKLHTAYVKFCNCELPAVTLIRYGLWPCSARMPATAVSLNFMDMVYCFMMEGHVSLKAICNSIGNHSCLLDNEVRLLYRSVVGECVDQFRYFRHMIRNLADIPQKWSPLECPACPKYGPMYISLDANMGLVRKVSSGSSHHPPNHSSELFVEDDEVRDFISQYGETSQGRQIDKNCSDFQAGSDFRSKNQCRKLATTGIFGAACRHGIPIVFLNMEHGERLSYPVMAIQKILEKFPEHTNINILYDIACKLHAHLKKRGTNGEEMLKQLNLALPIFHAYGHKRSCQISFGTMWSSGFGLTDGEIMERLWAYLRKFAHITKEMTPSHRVDLLTDALYYFTQKKLDSIDIFLKTRMNNACKVEREATAELTSKMQESESTLPDIVAWKKTEERLLSKEVLTPGTSPTWEEKYVKELLEYDTLRKQLELCCDPQRVLILNRTCERMESSLKKMERAHKIQVRWQAQDAKFKSADHLRQTKHKKELLTSIHKKSCEHSFAVSRSKKYSAGQSLAIRLARQMKVTGASLRRAVTAYNDREFSCGDLPNTITYEEVVNPSNPIYTRIQRTGLTAVEQSSVDLLNKRDRATEEQQILVGEMKQFLASKKTDHNKLLQCLVNMGDGSEMPQSEKGLHHLILIKLMIIEGQHERAAAAFGEFVDDVQHLAAFHIDFCTNVDFFPSHNKEDANYGNDEVVENDDEEVEEDDEEDEEEEVEEDDLRGGQPPI